MSTDKALHIFDQLVSSIGLYNFESWLPLVMTNKSLNDQNSVLSLWESFQLETLNQNICRMKVGVHNKSIRLATLGELGRFPLFIKGVCHALKYQAHLCKIEGNATFVGNCVKHMKLMNSSNLNSRWGRMEKSKKILQLNIQLSPKLIL